jgi:uncharacterized protein YabN with tetrapyrrole methylase and pyrophosphatase domain
MRLGSLTVVGTGIRLSQMSMEARTSIKSAEKVLYSAADPVTESAIKKLNSTAESLQPLYAPGKYCLVTYREMTARILSFVRKRLDVCAVFYGHPGVFVYSSHESIRRARLEGFTARMLPATSSEDCLFADLGIDPATSGCQSFEATDFLIRRRKFDPCSHLILWQIGQVGNWKPERQDCSTNLRTLVEVLCEHYEPKHKTVLYQAAQYGSCDPLIHRVALARIPEAPISPVTTLYVPPKAHGAIDYAMIDRLGIPRKLLRAAGRRNGRPSSEPTISAGSRRSRRSGVARPGADRP